VLFTDIVLSTELGDRDWRHLIERHHETVRCLLAMFHGVEVDAAGDGFLATFDGPTQAVRCAFEIVRARAVLGIDVRGRPHRRNDGWEGSRDRGGHWRPRWRSRPEVGGPGVSHREGPRCRIYLTLEDAGEHELKGIPERRRLYRVVSESP
jgi:class 3 adenylate cyclase